MTGFAIIFYLAIGFCVGVALDREPLWLRLIVACSACGLFSLVFPAL